MILALLLSCATPQECLDDSWCAEGEACLGGTCFVVECSRSEHCPVEQRCTDGNECVPGCDSDADCFVGDVCEAGSCSEPACVETELDCGFGERCDQDLGECVSWEQPECQDCALGCGEDQECVTLGGEVCEDTPDCPEGWLCEEFVLEEPRCQQGQVCPDGFTCEEGYCVQRQCRADRCFSSCDLTDPDCPGGFLCTEYRGGGGAICYGDCAYLESQGYLP